MAAVIGLAPARIEQILAESDAGRRIDVANFNSNDQTVIAGPKEDLGAVGPAFKAAGGRFIPLKVSAPFHSRYMHAPMLEFGRFLEGFTFRPPAIPVVSNVTALPYAADRVRETLADQIGHCVRWRDTVVFLLDAGVTEFVETGPGNVLTKLVSSIRNGK
jgi:trans-AT polyketide synthase/acyltransferase/oxidoreductase domain-containing protein